MTYLTRARPSGRLVELQEKGGAVQLGRCWVKIIVSRTEETMYATIRRYVPKTPNTKEAIEDLKHRIEDGFLPIVQEVRGFHSYGALNVGNREIVTISIFEDKTGATESTRKAAEFVQKDPLKDQLGKPEVLEGELMVLKEAGVGVR
jgi:hypothetical protein